MDSLREQCETSATKENAPVTEGNKGAEVVQQRDCTIASVPSKEVATQIAKLALAGHSVHHLNDGGFMVCKYGYSYLAKDMDALKAFAFKLGVK
jgi:hypothetical protein